MSKDRRREPQLRGGSIDAASQRRKSGFTGDEDVFIGNRLARPPSTRPNSRQRNVSSRTGAPLSLNNSSRSSPRNRTSGKPSPRSGTGSARPSPRNVENSEAEKAIKKKLLELYDGSRDSRVAELISVLMSKTALFSETCPKVLRALFKFVFLINAQETNSPSLRLVYDLVRSLDSDFMRSYLFQPFESNKINERVRHYLWVKSYLAKHDQSYFFSEKWHLDFETAWGLFRQSIEAPIEDFRTTLSDEEIRRYELSVTGSTKSSAPDISKAHDFICDYEVWRLEQFLHGYTYEEDGHEKQLKAKQEQDLWDLLINVYLESKLVSKNSTSATTNSSQGRSTVTSITVRQLLYDDNLARIVADDGTSDLKRAVDELVLHFKQLYANRLSLQRNQSSDVHNEFETDLLEETTDCLIEKIDLNFVREQLRKKFDGASSINKIHHFIWLTTFLDRLTQCQFEYQSKEQVKKIESALQLVITALCRSKVIPKKVLKNSGCDNTIIVIENPRTIEQLLASSDLNQLWMLNSFHLPGVGGEAARNIYEASSDESMQLFRSEIGHADFIALSTDPEHVFKDPKAAQFDFCERGIPTISMYSKIGVQTADQCYDILVDGWSTVIDLCGDQENSGINTLLEKIGLLRHDEIFKEIHAAPIDPQQLAQDHRVKHLVGLIEGEQQPVAELVEQELQRKFDELSTAPSMLTSRILLDALPSIFRNQPLSVRENSQHPITRIIAAMKSIMKEAYPHLKDIEYFFQTRESQANNCEFWYAYEEILKMRKSEVFHRAKMTRSANAYSSTPSPKHSGRKNSPPPLGSPGGMFRSKSTLNLSPREMTEDPGSVSRLESLRGGYSLSADPRKRNSGNGSASGKRRSGRPAEKKDIVGLLAEPLAVEPLASPKGNNKSDSRGSGIENSKGDSGNTSSVVSSELESQDSGTGVDNDRKSILKKMRPSRSGSKIIKFSSRLRRAPAALDLEPVSGSADEDAVSESAEGTQQPLAGSYGSFNRKKGSRLRRKKKQDSADKSSRSQESEESSHKSSGDDGSKSKFFGLGSKLKEMAGSSDSIPRPSPRKKSSTPRQSASPPTASSSPRRGGSWLVRKGSKVVSRDSSNSSSKAGSKSGSKKGSHKEKKNDDDLNATRTTEAQLTPEQKKALENGEGVKIGIDMF